MHLIMDNYGTHKTPLIRNWLAKRQRVHVHFTPTYGSWLNLVERWFAELTNKQLRRGAHRSVRELKTAIREFIDAHHEDLKPFVWTKTADEILASIARFAQRTLDAQAVQLISRTSESGHLENSARTSSRASLLDARTCSNCALWSVRIPQSVGALPSSSASCSASMTVTELTAEPPSTVSRIVLR